MNQLTRLQEQEHFEQLNDRAKKLFDALQVKIVYCQETGERNLLPLKEILDAYKVVMAARDKLWAKMYGDLLCPVLSEAEAERLENRYAYDRAMKVVGGAA